MTGQQFDTFPAFQANVKFYAWMKAVDYRLTAKIGLDSNDLPDCAYYDWFEDGVTPAAAAKMAIVEAGGF